MTNLSKYYDFYSIEGFEDIQVKYRIRKMLEYINAIKPKNILDIGCGMDPTFQYIDYEFDRYTIIEPNNKFCEIAMDVIHSTGRSDRVKVINDYFPTAYMLKEDYDLIICSGVLNEVDDPVEMINSVTGLCTRDTQVIIIVPNANSIHRLLGLQMKIIKSADELTARNKNLMQERVYDINTITADINMGGLKVDKSESYFIKPFTHKQMYEMVNLGIIDKDMLTGLFELTTVKGLEDFGAEIILACSKQ